MMYRILILPTFFLLLLSLGTAAQNGCTTLGQTPSTAFPVCGTDAFSQNSVPLCGGNTIPVPPCVSSGVTYTDINPFWYKFTCFSTGTLGFTLTPSNLGDDYDWQLFDVTGHNPNDVYTDASLFVACDWSGNTGVTGAAPSGTIVNGCAGYAYPPVSSMPTIDSGHNYLLLISHFTNTQSGYKLSFSGGTASITDTVAPALSAARAPCDGTTIYVKLNKNMKCNSLAADGSDFSINTSVSSIIAASGVNCSGSFDMDSAILTLNNPIPIGSYLISVKVGSDGNTILDNCDNSIPVGDSVPVTIYPQFPTPFDTLSIVNCSPTQLVLIFNKYIQCSSIEPHGSDFKITGDNPVAIDSAFGNCDNNGLTQTITINFAKPINLSKNDTITLQTGTDGNTIINECGKESVVGIFLPFITHDTVSAAFTPVITYGCTSDEITFDNPINNNKIIWLWQFSDGSTDTVPSFSRQIPLSVVIDTVKLFVSNGVCVDSATHIIPLAYDTLKAIFSAPEFYCPGDELIVTDTSTGKIMSYFWQYSDGETSTLPQPPTRTFPTPAQEENDVKLTLTVTDSIGCTDTVSHLIRVMRSCFIAVPTAFTPDAGFNNYLYPLSGFRAINLSFSVYNRFGQLVFSSHNYNNRWDGTIGGTPQPSGTYVWMLNYIDPDSLKPVSQKGTTVLIR